VDRNEVYSEIEKRLTDLMMGWLENADPSLPVILTAHASVQGASYGSERTVMLGADFVLPASLVKDPRLDYVALGHIHKPQDLNEGRHPPVIYPGSIERVDFGEARDDKFYVIVEVAKGQTQVEWKKLDGVRPFVDCRAVLGPALSQVEGSGENVTQTLMSALPKSKGLEGAIVRLTVEYPREWDTLIDDAAMRKHTEGCFEFHLVKRPQVEARIRLPADQTVSSLSPLDLLDQYWRASHTEDAGELQKLAQEIIFREDKRVPQPN
jgi:DNA repair protein SbcD/Mre11